MWLIAVPMQQLTKRSAVAPVLIDRRIANGDRAVSSHPRRILQYFGELTVCLVLAAAGQPGRCQSLRGHAELDVLYRSPKRAKEDRLVVRAILGIPFLAGSLREASLPARIAKDKDDRDGVGQIGLLDRRESFGVVDQTLRLPQEHGHDLVAHGKIVHNDKIPALHIGARRSPAAAIDDAL